MRSRSSVFPPAATASNMVPRPEVRSSSKAARAAIGSTARHTRFLYLGAFDRRCFDQHLHPTAALGKLRLRRPPFCFAGCRLQHPGTRSNGWIKAVTSGWEFSDNFHAHTDEPVVDLFAKRTYIGENGNLFPRVARHRPPFLARTASSPAAARCIEPET
jgi:hypothetical protein